MIKQRYETLATQDKYKCQGSQCSCKYTQMDPRQQLIAHEIEQRFLNSYKQDKTLEWKYIGV